MNAPAINLNKPVREQVSKEEWDARVNLAACYRLMAEYDMVEMVANHISVRVPGTHNEFLINPYGMLYEEITASSLVKIDIDANPAYAGQLRVQSIPAVFAFVAAPLGGTSGTGGT